MGRGEWGAWIWFGGVLCVIELQFCSGFQVFTYFKSSNLIICSQVHCGGACEVCFAKGFSFVFVWGPCFSPYRT